jgi:hemoglobin
MSLYEDLGGDPAIDAAVDIFYNKVIADESIKHFFYGIDIERQRSMQKKFLTFAFGGPNNYSGKGMRAAHKRQVNIGLNDAHFDAVVGHLGSTLQELNVPDAKISEAAAIAETVRDDVLGK